MRSDPQADESPRRRGVSDSPVCVGNRFLRSERLHLRRESAQLFACGQRLFKFPYRALFLVVPAASQSGLALMVQAPKRLFKRATARNAQKRRIREAFRLNAYPLREQAYRNGCRVLIAIMLVSNEQVPAERGHRAVQFLLHRMLAGVRHWPDSPKGIAQVAQASPSCSPSSE